MLPLSTLCHALGSVVTAKAANCWTPNDTGWRGNIRGDDKPKVAALDHLGA